MENLTRVVIVQHPREARLAICSAWLTRIALARAEIHRGYDFTNHGRVRELARLPGAALLYPGDLARPARDFANQPPPVLFVIDGTWLQSEKMLRANPFLSALARLEVASAEPSGYAGLRREPAPHCLSTLEAVACALGDLEGDAARFLPMRAAFRQAVEKQLACSQDGRRSPRHRRPRLS